MKTEKGNVVLGYTSESVLMLDCDLKREDEVKEFARDYSLFHDLGSALAMLTSDSGQLDLYGKPVKNFCIIFGKILHWEEIRWHIQECYRLGMINKAFTALRKFGSITVRVNAKNNRMPAPEIFYYFPNGDDGGVRGFLNHWEMCKELGMYEEDLASSDNPQA